MEDDKLEINILNLYKDENGHKCGYCKNPTGSCSFGLTTEKYPVSIYDKMMRDGWRRCGDYVYIPNLEKSCCKLYTCRLNVEDFKINKEQKKVMKRFRKYLSGEYELNKEKAKQEIEKEEIKKKEINIDKTKEKIENILKEYLKTKNFCVDIINKYIKIDKSFFEQKLNDIHVRNNTNKKNNFDYSIDFIFIINKIIESYKQKNNIIFDDIKQLDLELFNDFKQFYNSENESLELFEQTGHINIIDKTKPKKMIMEKKENEKKRKMKTKFLKKRRKRRKKKKKMKIQKNIHLNIFQKL